MTARPNEELDAALGLQRARLRSALGAGMPRAGWKICVNEPATQARLGLDGPFTGFLDGARRSDDGAVHVTSSDAISMAEAEIAILIGDVRPTLGDVEVARSCIESLAPAIELADYRGVTPDLASVVESSSYHAGWILGRPRSYDPQPILGRDCPRFQVNRSRAVEPDPDLVPADLARVVAQVAANLGRQGQTLERGDWILSGSCIAPVRVREGDLIEADFGSLGTVCTVLDREGCYRVRPAEPGHLPALPPVERAATALYEGLGLPAEVLEDSTGPSEFLEAQAAGLLHVALTPEGEPVGFAHVELRERRAHLEELGVHPDHGRRGLGRRLVRAVCAQALAAGRDAVTLTTYRDVPWNAPFYERLGFRVLEPREWTPQLEEQVEREDRRGLEREKRVVMSFECRCPPAA